MSTVDVVRAIVVSFMLASPSPVHGVATPRDGEHVVTPAAPWMEAPPPMGSLIASTDAATRITGDDLRATFVRDPSASDAWQRLAGWNDSTVQPCDDCTSRPNGVCWTGVTCTGGQVIKVDLSHKPDLKFMLGSQLDKLTALTNLKLRETGLHGWLPPIERLQQLIELDVSGTSLSGTIPRMVFGHPRLQTLACDNTDISGELGPLSAIIQQVSVGYTQVSGTLPGMNKPSKLQDLSIIATAISGTVPASLIDQQDISRLYMYYTQLSGTFPSVETARNLIEVDVDTTCPHSPSAGLSGTLPTGIDSLHSATNLDFHNNRISGTIPYPISVQADATNWQSLQTLYLQDTFISGTVPPLGCLTDLTKLDLHDSEFTGFAPGIYACGSLPRSLTHLYVEGNPINMTSNKVSVLLNELDLHALDFSFINIPVQLECRDSKCSQGDGPSKSFGTRVGRPTNGICYVDAFCAFRLLLYDIDDQPVKVGGLVHNMSLSLGDHQTHPMVEGHNGAFEATIPTAWVSKPGVYTFRFFHNGMQFTPVMLEGDIFAPWPGCYSMEAKKLKPPGTCDTLRTITFLPACEDGSKLSADGSRCVCDDKYYDTDVAGILVCSTGSWSDPEFLKEYKAVQRDRKRGVKCAQCPTQCVNCDRGNAIIKQGWRLMEMTATEVHQQTLNVADGKAQFVFACPWPEACPAGNISSQSEEQCLHNHRGVLCGPCRSGFSRQGSSDSSCRQCKDVSSYIRSQFGLNVVVFCLVIVAIICVASVVLYAAARFLSPWLKIAKTNGRILLGSAQVLSLLPSVLQIVFPQQPRAMLMFLSIGVVDVRDFLRFDCWGLNWYERWRLSVFGLPCATTLPFVIRWVWQSVGVRFNKDDIDPNAQRQINEKAANGLFFVVLLLYPQLSSEIFSALRCRQLGESSFWLEVDYLVDCTHDHYRTYRTLASALVVIVPFGIPLVLLGLLLKSWRRSLARWNQTPGKDRLTLIATRSWDPRDSIFAERQPGGDQDVESIFEYHRKQLEGTFAFCIDDYRNECFWFEPVDMLRKLSLSALLQFCNRGTAAQVFCGSAVAFISFGLQVRLQPYREQESNTLKAFVEAQIFLTFIIAFILRVLPDLTTSEPFDAELYGLVLLVSFLLLLLVAMPSLTAVQIYRKYRFRSGLVDMPGGRLLNVDRVSDSVAQ